MFLARDGARKGLLTKLRAARGPRNEVVKLAHS